MARQLQALVVDDDEQFSLLISSLLSSNDIKATVVNTGEQALEKIMLGDFDFMITDFNMPEMNGYELIKRIRSNSDHVDLKIILVTGGGADIVEMLKARKLSDHFLIKPFPLDTLLETITILDLQ